MKEMIDWKKAYAREHLIKIIINSKEVIKSVIQWIDTINDIFKRYGIDKKVKFFEDTNVIYLPSDKEGNTYVVLDFVSSTVMNILLSRNNIIYRNVQVSVSKGFYYVHYHGIDKNIESNRYHCIDVLMIDKILKYLLEYDDEDWDM